MLSEPEAGRNIKIKVHQATLPKAVTEEYRKCYRNRRGNSPELMVIARKPSWGDRELGFEGGHPMDTRHLSS